MSRSVKKVKTIDCVEFKRQAQARHYEATRGMAPDRRWEYSSRMIETGSLAGFWTAGTLAVIIAAWLCTVVSAGSAPAADPPLPNPDDPVDYIAWLNREYGAAIKKNAADLYNRAFAAYVPPSHELREQMKSQFGAPYRSEDAGPKTLESWLRANEQCLHLFTRAARVKDCYFPCESKSGLVLEMPRPHVAYFRNLGQLLHVRCLRLVRHGEYRLALDDIEALLRAAHHLYSQPTTLEWIRGLQFSETAYEVLREAITRTTKLRNLEAVQSRLRETDTALSPPTRQLLIDRLGMWQLLQTPSGDSDAEQVINCDEEMEVALEEIDRVMSHFHRLFSDSYAEAENRAELIGDELVDMRKRIPPKPGNEFRVRATVLIPASVAEPSIWYLAVKHRRHIAERNATYAVLAIQMYRMKHGRWPRSLADDVVGANEEQSIDPFSGRDLIYRVEDDQPLLYSVGLNGKDDRGRRGEKPWAEEGDQVFWPRRLN